MRLVWRGSVVVLLLIVALAISWLPWRELFTPDSSNAEEPASPPAVEAPQQEPEPPPLDLTPSAAPPTAPPSPASPAAARPVKGAPATRPDPNAPAAAKVVSLINVERRKGGCGPVHADARLAAAATGHSQDMVKRNYFSHTTPDGVDPWQRAKAAGYTRPTGENIAMGYRTAEEVVAGWMKSPGHRDNIMNCTSKAVGMGIAANAKGVKYWTQLFGAV